MGTRNFTPKEIAWIVTLPMRRYRMGSTIKEGYYDEATGRVFMVNEDGELTGETATPIQRPERHASADGQADAQGAEGEGNPSSEQSDAADGKKGKKGKKDKKEKKERRSKDKTTAAENKAGQEPADENANKSNRTLTIVGIVAVVVALIAAIALYVLLPGGGGFFKPEPTPSPSPVPPTPVPTEAPTPTPEPTPAGLVEVSVIQAVGDILKGQQINSSYVEQVTISMQEYNQLVAMGSTPCKWEELSTIEGMYTNSFIAAGSYLSNYYLTVADPIPANPWMDGSQTITLGVDAVEGVERPFFGAQVVLKVTKNVDWTVEGAEPAPDLSWPEGSEEPNPYANITMDETAVSDTVVQRVFTITSAVVSDLLDANGNSLFSTYVPYVEMPTVNRMGALTAIISNPEQLAAMTPASIVIKLTEQEMAAIGILDGASMVISVNGNADASSDLKYSVAWGTQAIMDSLFNADVTPDVAAETALVEEAPVEEPASDGLIPMEDVAVPPDAAEAAAGQ